MQKRFFLTVLQKGVIIISVYILVLSLWEFLKLKLVLILKQ